MQGPQAASCDRNDTLLLPGRKRYNPGKGILGTTCLIICATVAEDGDASAAKFEDEKGQGVECHGIGKVTDVLAFFSPAAFILSLNYTATPLASDLLCLFSSCPLSLRRLSGGCVIGFGARINSGGG